MFCIQKLNLSSVSVILLLLLLLLKVVLPLHIQHIVDVLHSKLHILVQPADLLGEGTERDE